MDPLLVNLFLNFLLDMIMQAPITEELVFRACMVPLLLCGGFSTYTVVFLCPIFFSLGEWKLPFFIFLGGCKFCLKWLSHFCKKVILLSIIQTCLREIDIFISPKMKYEFYFFVFKFFWVSSGRVGVKNRGGERGEFNLGTLIPRPQP